MGNWNFNFNSYSNQAYTQDIGCKMFCMRVAVNLKNLVTLDLLALNLTKVNLCVKLSNMLLIGLKTLSSVAYQMTNIVSKKLK